MPSIRPTLTGSACISPASVYDPLSARAAHHLGFDVMMLAGSIASAVVLGAPDLVVLTLTELADQARRITRVSPLPLLVDADHGFGNALSVMRCVQELEDAGVAALTIEDTLLPRPFGSDVDQLISTDEALGKFRAALAARRNPDTAILARTGALRVEGLDRCIERVSAYTATGVDGIFLVGIRTRDELEAIHAATDLPLVLGAASRDLLDRPYLASQGVRIVLTGHAPFQAAVRAMYETLAAIHQGATTADLGDAVAPADMLDHLTAARDYDGYTSRFLTPERPLQS